VVLDDRVTATLTLYLGRANRSTVLTRLDYHRDKTFKEEGWSNNRGGEEVDST